MLLFVCHANICRSAMAERLARQELAGQVRGPIAVGSAGTHAKVGEAMHPGAARVLRDLGVDASDFASRPVSADLIGRASLVLTATREQRAFCVRLAPAALRRTFTIRQLGRLATALRESGDQEGELLDGITRIRGGLQPVPSEEDDLADPVNGTRAEMRACARQIQLSLRPALSFIRTG
jgi:protein-tyrosine phosphatase